MKKIIAIVLAVVIAFGAGCVVMDLTHLDESREINIITLSSEMI